MFRLNKEMFTEKFDRKWKLMFVSSVSIIFFLFHLLRDIVIDIFHFRCDEFDKKFVAIHKKLAII